MLRSIAAAIVFTVTSSTLVNAQTIYAPVQYQYGSGNHVYYYGGSDPAVFDRAERRRCLDVLGDHPFTSQRYTQAYVHRRLIGQLDRVYSDCAPYVNARAYGYLPVDAANDAYAGVPRYFRKADLLRASVELPDGSVVVPPQARPIRVDRDRADRSATRPVIRPRAIIIIPKDKPKTSDKLVATAVR